MVEKGLYKQLYKQFASVCIWLRWQEEQKKFCLSNGRNSSWSIGCMIKDSWICGQVLIESFKAPTFVFMQRKHDHAFFNH